MLPPVVAENLRWLMTSLQLINEECFQTLFIKGSVTDAPCLKMLLSRGLGTAIVAGSTMVKLPQVMKIVANGDVAGLVTITQHNSILLLLSMITVKKCFFTNT